MVENTFLNLRLNENKIGFMLSMLLKTCFQIFFSVKDELLSNRGELNSKYIDRISFLRTAYLNTEYLGFNMRDALPHEIRTAINYGFDRKEMIKYLRN